MDQLADNHKPRSGFSRKRLIYIISIVIGFVICYLVVGYLFVNKSISDNVLSAKSIAVLPFKDFSPDDNQWFSDGVSDNILHSLAQMSELRVISFTSSATYRGTDKKIPQIAKELKVAYILEGSVTLYEGKVKIITQLIDANDKHLWSKEYDETFDDIIAIQNNVAQEVMDQLEITLSPREEITLNKYPTDNMEAYSLHLKGRLVDDSREEADLLKNIELNKQAIALDSTFAKAYAEVALSYFLINEYHPLTFDPLESRDQALSYADMALQLDDNTDLAWVVKGILFCYLDWEKSLDYFERALAINSNNTQATNSMRIYYEFGPKPDQEQSLRYAQITYQLNPISWRNSRQLFYSLLKNNNNLEKAEDHYQQTKFIYSETERLYREQILTAISDKGWNNVLQDMKERIRRQPDKALYYSNLARLNHNVFNDNINAINMAREAYKLDPESETNFYLHLLSEGQNFDEVWNILTSENYKSSVDKIIYLNHLWEYHFCKKEYEKALWVLSDSLYNNRYWRRTLTYAQIGNKKKVDSMNARFPWGENNFVYSDPHKATLYALFENKDSMFHHLDRISRFSQAKYVNGRREFDPYRNEERFKAFQRKWYFPVSVE